jgi:transposase InsO family protein
MFDGFRKDIDAGTERGRSPSGVPASEGAEHSRGQAPGLGEAARTPEVKPFEGVEEGIATEGPPEPTAPAATPDRPPALCARRRGTALRKKEETERRRDLTPQERLLVLDTWKRSGLPAGDFAPLVGLSRHTLYVWKRRFEERGPEGLLDQPRGSLRGSKLSDLTRRTILMLKEANPQWGCQRISDMLLRGPALAASPSAVARLLHEAGYELEEVPTRSHPDQPREFERAAPNELWQTDLFTFMLKRQNRRVYLVAFLDDHSRFIVGYGLHASQSSALVLEVLRAAVSSYQAPREILTDNGAQYITWRGKSAFTRQCEKLGIRQIVATPRRPQTLGKIERFWGSLWRECLESAVFLDLEDARRRLGLFIDHYNFQRPHQGIGGLVPADRFFGAAPEVLRTLKERVSANALDLARHGVPKTPFYLTGSAGGQPFSVYAEGERVILRRGDGEREEVDLVAPEGAKPPAELPEPLCPSAQVPEGALGDDEGTQEGGPPPAPGTSPLDEGLDRLRDDLQGNGETGGLR